MPNSGFVFTGQSGCLLPMLIMLNLFFGKLIFNSNRLWLGIEGILVLLFIIKIHTFARKISQQFWPKGDFSASSRRSPGPGSSSQDKVIDVEGEVVQEKRKLP